MDEVESFVSPEVLKAPHAFFGELRENDPVHWNDRHQTWVLTRYEDVQAAFLDRRLSSNTIQRFMRRYGETPPEDVAHSLALLETWMVFQDPPDHTRIRNVVRRAFTPRTVANLRPKVQQLVDQLWSELVLRANPETRVLDFDFVEDFAYHLPARVTCELLGAPASDHEQVRQWTEDLGPLINGNTGDDLRTRRATDAVTALETYLEGLIESFGGEPQDNLLGAMLVAEAEGQRLTRSEVIATAILLLDAGFKTTVALLSSSLLALLENPAQFELLVEDPGQIGEAIEEFQRYDGPVKALMRWAREDLVLAGTPVKQGERVLLVLSAANHDPRQFEQADVLDVRREAAPSHLGFGQGMHYCLGAPLARLEIEVALQKVLPALHETAAHPVPDFEKSWSPTMLARFLDHLDLRMHLDGQCSCPDRPRG